MLLPASVAYLSLVVLCTVDYMASWKGFVEGKAGGKMPIDERKLN